MGGKLIIVVDVPDADPAQIDPHELAEEVIDCYEQNRSYVAETFSVSFLSAEWDI